MDNLTLGFILIGVALLLLVAELMFTTGGILLVAAAILDLIGLVMVFAAGDRYVGLITLAAEAILLPLLAVLAFYVWPYTPMGRRLIMQTIEQEGATLAASPTNQELEQ